MKKDLASARPWKRGYQDNQVIYSDYKQIAVIQCREKEWQDNADLIVRAVNNFDALLEACKWALSMFDYSEVYESACRNGSAHQGLIPALKKAIANAEK